MTGFDASLKVGRFSSGAILILGCAVPSSILYFGMNGDLIGVNRPETIKEQVSFCFSRSTGMLALSGNNRL